MLNNTNPKISVVIAIYNIEKYLHRCIISVLSQTYQNQEIILVDDGSTDNSSSICEAYSKMDSRVIVIHQENQGLSAARNVGTRNASGEWITYIDGDDYVHPCFLECLYLSAMKSNANIIVCGSKIVTNGTTEHKPLPKIHQKLYSGEQALKIMLYQKHFDVSAWGKLYQLNASKPIIFPHGKVYEDIVPVTQQIAQAEQVSWINLPLYYYFQRPGSIMRTANLKNIYDEIEMTERMYAWVAQNYSSAEPAALCKLFSNYCQILCSFPLKCTCLEQTRKRILHTLKKCAWRVLYDRHARWKNRCAALLALINPQWICFLSH